MPLTDRDLTRREDELLTPALAGVDRGLAAAGRRPWRLSSQLYVGFFGGPIAVAVIAWLNAERLGGFGRRERLLTIAAGVVGVVAAVVAVLVLDANVRSEIRLAYHATGIATAVGLRSLQAAADRRFVFRHGDQAYDSLWRPGLLAVFPLGFLLNVLLYLAASL